MVLSKKKLWTTRELVKELHKPVTRKFETRKAQSSFIDNIRGADLADMQLISKLIQDFDFYYLLLIFLVNILGFFL